MRDKATVRHRVDFRNQTDARMVACHARIALPIELNPGPPERRLDVSENSFAPHNANR